jgi:hypothetical protein
VILSFSRLPLRVVTAVTLGNTFAPAADATLFDFSCVTRAVSPAATSHLLLKDTHIHNHVPTAPSAASVREELITGQQG